MDQFDKLTYTFHFGFVIWSNQVIFWEQRKQLDFITQLSHANCFVKEAAFDLVFFKDFSCGYIDKSVSRPAILPRDAVSQVLKLFGFLLQRIKSYRRFPQLSLEQVGIWLSMPSAVSSAFLV